IMYAAVCFALLVASPYPDEHPAVFYSFAGAMVALVGIRMLLLRGAARLTSSKEQRLLLFSVPFIAAGLLWSVFTGVTEILYGGAWLSYLMHMLVGFAALTTVLSYSALKRTTLAYCAALILPSLAMVMYAGHESAPVLVLLGVMFGVLNVPAVARL